MTVVQPVDERHAAKVRRAAEMHLMWDAEDAARVVDLEEADRERVAR